MRRSADTRRLIAGVVFTAVVVVLVVVAFWPGGGLSCSPETTVPAVSSTAAAAPTTLAVPTTLTVPTTLGSTTSNAAGPVTTAATGTAPVTTTTEPPPMPPLAFDIDRAMEHVKVLASDIGVRKSGTAAEAEAATYAAEYLTGLGYQVEITEVPLPNGQVSHNVRASKDGSSGMVVAVGAHLDSKVPSPGANDNASGVAVVLELARDFREADTVATLEFILFGAEEIVDGNKDHHHYGSRLYVHDMTTEAQDALVAMISPDLVAYGDELLVRTMGRGPQLLSDMLIEFSLARGIPARYVRDPGSSGWSDHEAFELAGYPVAWLEWQDDPTYHTAGDAYEHLQPGVMQQTGEMLRAFLALLSEDDLTALAAARLLD